MTTRILAASLLACLSVTTPALAQAVRSGPTFSLGGTPFVVTPDAAYDPVHDRYLVVHGHGFIEGLLTDGTGRTIKAFPVNSTHGAEYAQTPRLAFSADVNNGAGGYLVTWHETISALVTQARGRMVSADGVPLGTDFVISTEATVPGASTNWTMGAAVAYSTASHEFLVSWMGSYTTTNDIRFNRVSAAGAVLQPLPTNVTATTPDWERDPCVAYDPDTDEFFIVFAGFHDRAGYAYIGGQRVKAGTGQLLGGTQEYDRTVATYIPAVTYNSAAKQYLVVWYHRVSSAAAFYGVVVNPDGTAPGQVIVESSFYTAYDALDVKYNAGSGDYLLVTHSNNWEDAAVSIGASGTPIDNGFVVTNTPDFRAVTSGDGNFSPRIAANIGRRTWMLVTASRFQSVAAQMVQSQNTSTAAPSTPTAPAPSPHPVMSVDAPANNSTVSTSGFVIAGWAADLGTSSGTGVDAVVVWAWPTNGGAAILAGLAAYGNGRPDVAAAFGNAQLTNSGFGMTATLPAGSYTLSVYPHSTVSGTWATPTILRVTVQAPASKPLMWVDTPTQNQTVSSSAVHIGGWAVDLASPGGTGVDAIHVWAYPARNPTQPIFLGAAVLGTQRPDVAAFLGSTRFTPAGFDLVTTLAPDNYRVVVFAHSTVTGTFNNALVINVKVQ